MRPLRTLTNVPPKVEKILSDSTVLGFWPVATFVGVAHRTSDDRNAPYLWYEVIFR